MNRESLREQDRKKRRLSHHVDVCVEVFNISVQSALAQLQLCGYFKYNLLHLNGKCTFFKIIIIITDLKAYFSHQLLKCDALLLMKISTVICFTSTSYCIKVLLTSIAMYCHMFHIM